MCWDGAKAYDGHGSKKYFSKWIRDPLHAHFWMHFFFLRDNSVTAQVTSSLLHKVRDVLQQEICFIKSNNWLTRFPSSPEFHTGGLNIPHMQRDSPCEAFAACLKIRAVKSKKVGSGFSFRLGQMVSLLKSVFAFLWLCLTAMNFQMETWQAVSWQRLLPQHT